MEKNQLLQTLFSSIKTGYFEFNLRQANSLKKNGKYTDYMKSIKENLAKSLVQGDYLVINLDDSPLQEEDNYDPNLCEFYEASSFPSHIWDRKIMARPEVYERVLQNTPYEKKKVTNPFKVLFLENIIGNIYRWSCGRNIGLIMR